uniref:Uncharacterized protein n=1 Tax=Oryza meridionalis TaxID=40149 RepID=A0A0E0F749_9ORYZ
MAVLGAEGKEVLTSKDGGRRRVRRSSAPEPPSTAAVAPSPSPSSSRAAPLGTVTTSSPSA